MFTRVSCLVVLAVAGQSSAAVIVPNSIAAPFEDWSRGYDNSTYAEWDVFTSAFGAGNPPDVGEVGPSGAVVEQTIPGAVLTGGGNIYSPGGAPTFEVEFPGLAQGPAGKTRVVAQVRALGTAIDLSTVLLTPAAGSVVAPTFSTLSTSGVGFGAAEEHLFAWDLSGNADSYSLAFAGSGAHTSLDRVVIDTFTQADAFTAFPTNVPSPASVWLAAVAGAAFLTRSSRASEG